MADDPKQRPPSEGTPVGKPRPSTTPGAAKPATPLSARLRALGNPGAGGARKQTMMGLSPVTLPAQAAKNDDSAATTGGPPAKGAPMPPLPRRSSAPAIGSGFSPPTARKSTAPGPSLPAQTPAKPGLPAIPKLSDEDTGWDVGAGARVPQPSRMFAKSPASTPVKPLASKSTMFGLQPQSTPPQKPAPVTVQPKLGSPVSAPVSAWSKPSPGLSPTPKPKLTPPPGAAMSSPKFDVDVDDDFSRQDPFSAGASVAGGPDSGIVHSANAGMLVPGSGFDWRGKLGSVRSFMASGFGKTRSFAVTGFNKARPFVASSFGKARPFVVSNWDRLCKVLPEPVVRYLPHAGIFLAGLLFGALLFGGSDGDASASVLKASIVPCESSETKTAPSGTGKPAAPVAALARAPDDAEPAVADETDDEPDPERDGAGAGPGAGAGEAGGEGTPVVGDGECMIVLTSVPAGAAVTVDGSPAGATPVDLPGLPCGQPVRVGLSRDGHVAFTKAYTLADGESRKVRVPLHRKRVGLKISSSPSGAKVKIGRKTIGETPIETDVVVNQSARIKVTLYGYQDAKKTIVPREGGPNPTKLNVTLKKSKRGFLGRTTHKSD